MHAAHRVATFGRQHLQAILPLSGGVLYSAASTLRPGEVYLLGHNPGGDPANLKLPTVNRSLEELPSKTTNSYLDDLWSGRKGGQAPLQRRIIWLLKQLGLDPRSVAASNLIFVRSRDAAGSKFEEYSRLCWPVHEEILQVVQPRLVIAYGNSSRSPYRFLFDHIGIDAPEEAHPSGHGKWKCRSFVVPGRFRVVGVPHLSRYDISAHDDVVDWIMKLAKPASSHS